ncbi:MAG: AmmeMemoRadiSam system radical SAM enzyme [Oleispira sp.]|nr:AmmeMemoRadiSam system radical SAM enzyme [Oleispira sp.]
MKYLTQPPASYPTEFWHKLDDGRIQCDVCPRACKLRPDQRGLCYVRGREHDEIVLYSYGRSSGFCIDPIEKKPLNHFLPGTSVLSFGTAGCNLACKFCQNWDMSKSRKMDTLADSAMPEKLANTALQLDCASIAYTYNDPVVFMEYATDTAQACHEKGIKAVAVSAGYICEKPREMFYRYMDAANIDLKGFSESFYKKICGGQLQSVLETLKYIHAETQAWLEVTTLLIPGENDSDEELEAMPQWFYTHLGPKVPLHFSAFHPDWKMLDKAKTPSETLTRARQIAVNNGLNYVYTGNVHDPKGSSSYCPNCSERVIERDWYQLGYYGLNHQGQCLHCNHQIPGVFDGPAGHWGSQRVPVKINTINLI